MGLKKSKGKKVSIYHLTEEELYKKMPKLKKRNFSDIKDEKKRLFYIRVWFFTECQPLHKLPNYNKRCWDKDSCYELDHILPISFAYLEGISPHLVGSLDNLRFIPKKQNRDKSYRLTEESHKILRKFKQL